MTIPPPPIPRPPYRTRRRKLGETVDGHPKAERRLGQFAVDYDLLEYNWNDLLVIFRNMVVVRAEVRMDTLCIEYLAYSPYFAPLGEGEVAPWYQDTITRHPDGAVSVTWHRRENLR